MVICDMDFSRNKVVAFSAACVVGILRDVGTKEESAVALDLQKFLQHWRTIGLGWV